MGIVCLLQVFHHGVRFIIPFSGTTLRLEMRFTPCPGKIVSKGCQIFFPGRPLPGKPFLPGLLFPFPPQSFSLLGCGTQIKKKRRPIRSAVFTFLQT